VSSGGLDLTKNDWRGRADRREHSSPSVLISAENCLDAPSLTCQLFQARQCGRHPASATDLRLINAQLRRRIWLLVTALPINITANVSKRTNRNLPVRNTLVGQRLLVLYIDPESYNAQRYRQTDGRTDGDTNNTIHYNIKICNAHNVCQLVSTQYSYLSCCLGGAVIGRRTRDRKVASSTPGRGAIKSTRSTQPSIPQG